MISRRPTFFCVLVTMLVVAACAQSVYADPPQFRSSLDYEQRYLSPFPGFDTHFIASITPQEYVSLVQLNRRSPYEMEYDFPDYSVSYMRRLERNQTMIPVNSPLDSFVQRRLALSEDEMEHNLTRESLIKEQNEKAGGLFQFTIPIPSRAFESIFGEGGAGLRVSGYRRISFTGRSSWSDKAQTAFFKQSKFPTLQMEQDYRFDIEGTIGSKISVKVSQDSRNDIPLANRLILRYKGSEDDVLQTVEAGNTTLNLPATQFLAYSTRVQGLFGIKATAQLADLSITAIASQEKGSTESVAISAAGASASAKTVIRDIDFRERMIFDLGRLPLRRAASDTLPEPEKYDFMFPDTANGIAGDSITRLIVYVDDLSGDLTERFTRPVGNCYIDPTDTLSDDPKGIYRTTGYFKTIDATNYYLQPTQFYIEFLQSFITNDDIIGVYMEVLRRRDGASWVDTIGNITSDTMKLKLIKPQAYNDVNHHIWEYQWRNVYYLGQQNIDLRDFNVEIYKGKPINNQEVDPNDLDHNQQGIKYLQILGLDRGDDNSQPPPDGEIDRYVYIDQTLGLLIFPSRHPFDDTLSFVNDDNGQPVALTESVPDIYINQNKQTLGTVSQYYIAVSSRASGSAVIQLNATNIIENSEVVMNGTERLVRGQDYNIDYDFGRLTLLRDDLTDINSNVSITFERAPFFSLERKTLLGTRLEYVPNRDFNIGTTILYKSEKSTNRKPKVGEETSKMLVWDMDMDYSFKNPLLTTFANALPFVSASAESYMKVSAEVAQSRPNPNVDGEVYIDDFEGSKDSYSLGIPRKTWRFASRPLGVDTTFSELAHVAWFNPIDGVPVTDIWDRQIGTGEASTANVLEIHFRPVDHKFVKDTVQNIIDSTSVSIEPEKSWAGFMRNLSQGVATQIQDAQLLEIRMRTGGSKNANFPGLMHIDLGRISEDIDGDGQLDTENPDPAQILSPEEDVGLDGKADQNEFGYDPENGVYDPAGDDFAFDNIWRINGTENNRDDPDGGNRADTEDPDLNGLSFANSYFSYKVNLADTLDPKSFYVAGTMDSVTGWETIRIPLRDPDALDTIVGDASWNNIFYARIWFDSATTLNIPADGYKIEIASIDLISTTWADSFYVADSIRSGDAKFDVAVINNEVDSRYDPPVAGYYDPQLNKTETEQSLLLSYENLNSQVAVFSPDSGIILAADTGLAVRKFFRSMNFMGYGRLQAYVWGDTGTAHDSVMYFFRLGSDKDAYYEYRTMLKPHWDPANFIDIDFSKITALKARLLEDRQKGIDSSLTRVSEDGKYAVRIKPYGQDPTLTRMQYFSMGVVNKTASRPVTGEVWVDELRLTDVRDDVGMAGRVTVTGNMSDLGNYSFSYSTQDAYYRGVSSATKGGAADNLGSGQTKTNYSFSGSIKMDKFFPRSLELQLPVRVSWSQSVQDPLLRSGTDITVPEELRSVEKAVTITRSFGVSERFSKKTRNPLFTLLLNRLSSSFSYNTTKGHSATQPKFFREQYDAKSTFDMSVGKPPSITPLGWMGFLKIPFGVSKTRLYLYPTRLNFNGNLTGSYSTSVNQNSVNPTTRKLDFVGTMDVGFKVFENLSGSYSVRTDRDLRDPRTVNIVLNPKEFRLGVERTYSQNSSLSYSPSLFRFFTHKFTYSARYADTYRSSGRDTTFVHSAQSTVNGDVTMTFNHQMLIGSNRPQRQAPRGSNRRADTKSSSSSSSSSSSFNIFSLMLRGIRTISDAIDPVSGKVGTSRSLSYPGLAGKATAPFRFGLTDDPGVEPVQTVGGIVRQTKSINKTVSASSGVSLFAGIGVDANYTRNSRESFDAQPLKTISVGWPDLSLDLRSVRGLWYLGRLINALSPSSRYTKTTETKHRTNAPNPYEIRVREAFSPLVSFSVNPLKSMRTTARYERTISMTTQYYENTGKKQNIVRQTSETYSGTWSYRFSSPSGIKLPVFGRLKFQSNLNVTVDVSLRRSHDESAKAASDLVYSTTGERTNLTVSPTASYSFSSTVKGGLSARWQDDNDKQRREKRHTRELGFWVELQF